MNRQQAIRRIAIHANRVLALIPDKAEARRRYWQLVEDTCDYRISISNQETSELGFYLEPSPMFISPRTGEQTRIERSPGPLKFSAELAARWQAWDAEFQELERLNPQLELHELLSFIGETHEAASWPTGLDWKILRWVEAGDISAPLPFSDRYTVVTPKHLNRLVELRKLCAGWLIQQKGGAIVLVRDAELQQLAAEQNALEDKRHAQMEAFLLRQERIKARGPEIVSLARADGVFWNALRVWELRREQKRPTAMTTPSGVAFELKDIPFSEPFALGIIAEALPGQSRQTATLYVAGQLDNPPLDPIFADFIATIRQQDEALDRSTMVMLLRNEVRRELGLDGLLAWLDGPSIGVG